MEQETNNSTFLVPSTNASLREDEVCRRNYLPAGTTFSRRMFHFYNKNKLFFLLKCVCKESRKHSFNTASG